MSAQPEALRLVVEHTAADAFENAIRRIGVVAACEWFGHAPNSEFTKETERVLRERSDQHGAAIAAATGEAA